MCICFQNDNEYATLLEIYYTFFLYKKKKKVHSVET